MLKLGHKKPGTEPGRYCFLRWCRVYPFKVIQTSLRPLLLLRSTVKSPQGSSQHLVSETELGVMKRVILLGRVKIKSFYQ